MKRKGGRKCIKSKTKGKKKKGGAGMFQQEESQEQGSLNMVKVEYTDLKVGKDYFIEKIGFKGETIGKGVGINYIGFEKFDYFGASHKDMKLGFPFSYIDRNAIYNKDPLVKFKKILSSVNTDEKMFVETNPVPCGNDGPAECSSKRLKPNSTFKPNLTHLTHLKPYGAGKNKNFGYKFYEMTQNELAKRSFENLLSNYIDPSMAKEYTKHLFPGGSGPNNMAFGSKKRKRRRSRRSKRR